ncbi:MAG: type II secretion system F family protein [Alphaproteobacteria bacterium]|nr:type II secretion system F family protein [Alphaproteobacteria bacterium]
MSIFDTLTSPDFLVAVFAAISATAVIFTFGAQFFDRSDMKVRIKKVALERERLRAVEMSRLRGDKGSTERASRAEAKGFIKSFVERLSLRKAFDDGTAVAKLANAGYRSPAHLTTYLFLRSVSPIALLLISFFYLGFVVMPDRPLYLIALYSAGIGLLGNYLPSILLKNQIIKRQKSIRRAWPDCLDLVLLCVESGMSIEHALKRVAKEIGMQSPELAEEITLTTAELSFLEDRTRAYENLGLRTGLDGVRQVMTSLIQADRYGTAVATALRVMAEEGREQRMAEAEKKAASLPPKLTVPLILFFLPVLFIVVIAPAMIRVFSQNVSIGF